MEHDIAGLITNGGPGLSTGSWLKVSAASLARVTFRCLTPDARPGGPGHAAPG